MGSGNNLVLTVAPKDVNDPQFEFERQQFHSKSFQAMAKQENL